MRVLRDLTLMLGRRVAYSEDKSGSVAQGIHEWDCGSYSAVTQADASRHECKKKSEIQIIVSLLLLIYTSTHVN